MVEHYPLSNDQQQRLLTIDSKIDEFWTNVTSALRTIELSHIQHQNCKRNIQRDIDLGNKLVTATMKAPFGS